MSIEIPAVEGEAQDVEVGSRLPDRAAGASAQGQRALPRDAHAAGGGPGALDRAGQRRAGREPDAGHGRVAVRRHREPVPRRALRRRRGRHRGPHDQGARRHAADTGARAPSG
ncbi:MAG: hypothetical protein WKF40_04200 [Thermoleophilaceae bacterium]